MADDGFVTAYPPGGGEKRRVPRHYLDAPFKFKIPASQQVREPAAPAANTVTEPAKRGTKKEVAG